jgi:hypothetical protein
MMMRQPMRSAVVAALEEAKTSKIVAATPSSTIPTKCHHGRPFGRKNKKPSTLALSATVLPNVTLAQPIVPQASAANMFSFFSFASAQCREHHRLPHKFAKFMDGHELHEAILRDVSSDGPPYELKVYYDGEGDLFFKVGWLHFAEDYDLHKG